MGRTGHVQSGKMAIESTKDTRIIFPVLVWAEKLPWFGLRSMLLSHLCSNAPHLLGQDLAMLEMSLTIATLFRRYDLTLLPSFEMEYLPSFTLRPKHGLPVYIARRQS